MFTLSVTSPSSPVVTTATVTVEMNAPPSSGVAIVDPVEGVSLETLFQIRTLYWVDDPNDYPLSYIISSYTWNPSMKTIIKSKNEDLVFLHSSHKDWKAKITLLMYSLMRLMCMGTLKRYYFS